MRISKYLASIAVASAVLLTGAVAQAAPKGWSKGNKGGGAGAAALADGTWRPQGFGKGGKKGWGGTTDEYGVYTANKLPPGLQKKEPAPAAVPTTP